MQRYFFDVRDNDRLIPDREGIPIEGGPDAARREALAALADYTKDIAVDDAVFNELPQRHVAIEVRDGDSRPLMKAELELQVEVSASR